MLIGDILPQGLVVLFDYFDLDGAVRKRFFLYNPVLRMITFQRPLVVLNFFLHLPDCKIVGNLLLQHEVERLANTRRFDSLQKEHLQKK